MQGRAGKAPKREMVIESPQQYKCLAEIEAEVEAGAQVAAVSDAEVYLKTRFEQSLSNCPRFLISGFPSSYKSSFEEKLKRV